MTDLVGVKNDSYDINNIGQIVGSAAINGPTHAFLWDDGEVTDLSTLGGSSSEALAMNDIGQIVGMSDDATNWNTAFLWSDGVMTNLNDLLLANSGWSHLQFAHDINNNGQIVGWGYTNGEGHAFLMTPVPEPMTISLLAFGGLTIFRRRKK